MPHGPAVATVAAKHDEFNPFSSMEKLFNRAADELSLHNCPFHSLAKQEPDLICGMNQAFLDGMLRGMGNESIEAALTCVPGDCCVTLRRHGAEKGPATDGTGGDPEGSGLPTESSAPLPQ